LNIFAELERELSKRIGVDDFECMTKAIEKDRISFTTKSNRSGVVLSSVYSVVQKYGGTIPVNSAPNQGQYSSHNKKE